MHRETAAAVAIIFTAALNVSPVLAKEAGELPVIGGHPVIVFEKYEVAPGSAGEVEFEIGED